MIASLVLTVLSAAAYLLFYSAYIPRIGFDRVLHLQFPIPHSAHLVARNHDNHDSSPSYPWPYAVANLGADLVSNQPYDVALELHMPRSPGNVDLGNFMLDLELLGGASDTGTETQQHPLHPDAVTIGTGNRTGVLARSSRPATLTYYSDMVEGLGIVAGMPLYILGWKSEAEMLEIVMMEGVEFRRGWANVPRRARLEVRMDQSNGGKLQVYGCKVKFMARFRGLRYAFPTSAPWMVAIDWLTRTRWFMYKHRIIAFFLFTTIFWTVSTTTTILAYLALSYAFLSPQQAQPTQRARPSPLPTPDSNVPPSPSPPSTPSLSDTSRTFPTLRSQPPLHFSPYPSQSHPEHRDRDHDSGLGSSLPEDARPGASATSSLFSAAWARTEAGNRAAQRYPTPEPEPEAGEVRVATPGEVADDEEEDAELVEGDVVEGSGAEREAREDGREVRRRRSRLFARVGQEGEE